MSPKNEQDLDLSGNEIASVPTESLSTLRSLRRLNMAENQLFDLDPFPAHSLLALEQLNLSGNPLQQLPSSSLDGLPVLRHFSAANCGLKQVGRLSGGDSAMQTLGD